MPSSSAAVSVAIPLIQKWACATSGRSAFQRRARYAAKAGMWGSSWSLGTGTGGPAGTCSTVTPGAREAVPGSSLPVRRV